MIVQPFRSKDSDSFHTNTLCPEGKAIAPGDRLSDEGGLPECGSCQAVAGVRLAARSAEEAVRRDQRIMAEAEVQAGFGVVIHFSGSDEVLLSEGAYAVFGLTPTGTLIAAEVMASIVHPDDMSAAEAGNRELMETGSYTMRHRVVWPDGTIRWIRGSARLVPETADSPEYVLGTVVDVTDEIET